METEQIAVKVSHASRFGPRRLAARLRFGIRALAMNRWFLASLAMLPICWLTACYFFGTPQDTHPTGFIQYDQAYYMAEARQHFADGFHLLYGLPASFDYDTPGVYFHPQTLLLGAVVKITGIEPGWVYSVFGLVATLIFFRLAIALYECVVGLRSGAQFLVLPLFLWGGGIALLCGFLFKLTAGGSILTFDTGGWGANLGRGVIYGVEAYYHALFFGAVLALLQRRYAIALVLVATTCASHPFTGVELVSILAGWVILEAAVDREAAPPLWFRAGILLLLLLHLSYWLILLPRLSPEHAALTPLWWMPWVLHWYNEVPEYSIVGLAALWQLRTRKRLLSALQDRTLRLLLVWFAGAFLLSNHDLFISPRQPIHFTHGYLWVPLFLIGAPAMIKIAERLLAAPWRIGLPTSVALSALMFLDNAGWFAGAGLDLLRNGRDVSFFPNPIYIRRSAWDVLHRLNDKVYAGGLVVSNARELSYQVIVYTPLRAWYSQMWNTPYPEERLAELDALFRDGRDLDDWCCRRMIGIVDRHKDHDATEKLQALGYRLAYQNVDYDVLLRSDRASRGDVTPQTIPLQ
jgi:hypothetical protein